MVVGVEDGSVTGKIAVGQNMNNDDGMGDVTLYDQNSTINF